MTLLVAKCERSDFIYVLAFTFQYCQKHLSAIHMAVTVDKVVFFVKNVCGLDVKAAVY
jgi:hypothetical protein